MAFPVPSLVIDAAAPGYAQHLTTDVNDALNRLAVAASDAIESIDELDRAYAEYTTHGNTGVAIPVDGTIPQITEGAVILSGTVTPHSASNRMRCRVHIDCSVAVAFDHVCVALFRDAVANALTAKAEVPGTAVSHAGAIEFEFEETGLPAGVAVTYSVRIGPNGAGGSIMWLNGNSAGQRFGGVEKCTLVIEELKP